MASRTLALCNKASVENHIDRVLANKKHFLDVVLMDFFLMRSYLLGFAPLWKSLWIFKTVVAVKFFHNLFIVCIGKAFTQRMLLVPLRSHCSRNC